MRRVISVDGSACHLLLMPATLVLGSVYLARAGAGRPRPRSHASTVAAVWYAGLHLLVLLPAWLPGGRTSIVSGLLRRLAGLVGL